jgi:hypothetical protein
MMIKSSFVLRECRWYRHAVAESQVGLFGARSCEENLTAVSEQGNVRYVLWDLTSDIILMIDRMER